MYGIYAISSLLSLWYSCSFSLLSKNSPSILKLMFLILLHYQLLLKGSKALHLFPLVYVFSCVTCAFNIHYSVYPRKYIVICWFGLRHSWNEADEDEMLKSFRFFLMLKYLLNIVSNVIFSHLCIKWAESINLLCCVAPGRNKTKYFSDVRSCIHRIAESWLAEVSQWPCLRFQWTKVIRRNVANV